MSSDTARGQNGAAFSPLVQRAPTRWIPPRTATTFYQPGMQPVREGDGAGPLPPNPGFWGGGADCCEGACTRACRLIGWMRDSLGCAPSTLRADRFPFLNIAPQSVGGSIELGCRALNGQRAVPGPGLRAHVPSSVAIAMGRGARHGFSGDGRSRARAIGRGPPGAPRRPARAVRASPDGSPCECRAALPTEIATTHPLSPVRCARTRTHPGVMWRSRAGGDGRRPPGRRREEAPPVALCRHRPHNPRLLWQHPGRLRRLPLHHSPRFSQSSQHDVNVS